MKLKYYLMLSAALSCSVAIAQNIGIGTVTPNASALLDINTNALNPKKGFHLCWCSRGLALVGVYHQQLRPILEFPQKGVKPNHFRIADDVNNPNSSTPVS